MAIDTTRAETWDEYIGQEALKARLRAYIDAAVEQIRPLEHVLLAAGPGYGKTTLAEIIAKEMSGVFRKVQMPVSEAALARIIQECDNFGEYCVLFLDEVHAASKKEQEFLQPLLEFGYISDKRGREYHALNLTVIGATTEADQLKRPLFDRFALRPDYDKYTVEEIARILMFKVGKLEVELDEADALVLAGAAGGTPRHAGDFAYAARALQVKFMRPPTAAEVLELCRIDEQGLTRAHYDYLETLHLLGDTTGLSNLKSVLRLPEAVIRDLEMLLLQYDMIALTPSGREMMNNGLRKLNLKRKVPAS